MDADRSRRTRRLWAVASIVVLAATAVAVVVVDRYRRPTPASAEPAALVLADPAAVYDPVAAGEPLPAGYRPLLDRDQIEPVYSPRFTTADAVDWPEDSLVLGVAAGRTCAASPHTPYTSGVLGGTSGMRLETTCQAAVTRIADAGEEGMAMRHISPSTADCREEGPGTAPWPLSGDVTTG